ncbi:MAG: glycine zipper family protein [Pseudomonadota bacterium]
MKTTRVSIFVTITGIVLAGCASHPDPIIDSKGVDMAKYQQDLAECREYAKSVSATEGAAKGAALGAVVGAAAGAISGNPDAGAGYGAISGGTQSGLSNKREQERVVKRCVSGRGYKVLN